MDEAAHTRLQALQRHLNTYVAPAAGLNARAYRQPKAAEGQAMRSPAPHALLDGELLAQFEHLPWGEQHAAAASAGLTRQQALSHLHQLSAGTAFL